MMQRDADMQQGWLDSDLDAQFKNDNLFYQAQGESNANYRDGYNTGADFTDGIDSLNDYTAWRSPQVSAFDATYGAPGNSTLGELGNIGGMIGGGLAHLAFDTTTDTIGMGITSAHFYIDPIGAGKDLLNGNTLGGQFSIGTQNWIDSAINNTGANPFAGGFGNEQMKDGFEIGFGAASLGMGGIGAGIKGGGKVDDGVSVTTNLSRPDWYNSVSGVDGDFGYLPTLRLDFPDFTRHFRAPEKTPLRISREIARRCVNDV